MMSWLDESVAAALKRQDETLSEIFGDGYSIESLDTDRAVVSSRNFEWRIWYDRRRDRSVGSELNLGVGEPWQYEASLQTLWQFFGEEEPAHLPRDASGIVKLSLDDQVLHELELLRRVATVADPALARDASFFARGYNQAYTDYASGKWDLS
jgi:hypothetical protein